MALLSVIRRWHHRDGKADVLIRNSSTGFWYLSAMDGTSMLPGDSGVVAMPANLSWTEQQSEDFT